MYSGVKDIFNLASKDVVPQIDDIASLVRFSAPWSRSIIKVYKSTVDLII